MRVLRSSLLIFLMIVCSGFLPDHNSEARSALRWYTWNEGYARGVREGKIILVDAYTDWCGWCKKMDKNTYTNAAVIKKINEHFIPVKFNPETPGVVYVVGDKSYTGKELYDLLTRGEATGFPTTYYILPKKMSVVKDPGYKDPESFIRMLDHVIAESKK